MSRAFQWLLDPFSVPAESEVGGVRIQILSLPFLPYQTPEHSLALRGSLEVSLQIVIPWEINAVNGEGVPRATVVSQIPAFPASLVLRR